METADIHMLKIQMTLTDTNSTASHSAILTCTIPLKEVQSLTDLMFCLSKYKHVQ